MNIKSVLVYTLLLTASGQLVAADSLPLWELGIGGGAISLPEYRGAKETDRFAFPFIYPFYRGERIRADQDGLRGILFQSDKLKLNISADGNPGVDSNDVAARAGMPNLDPTLQLGPTLQVRLWEHGDRKMILNLPVRGVIAIDGTDFNHVGYAASPHLTWYQEFDYADRHWRLGLSGGLEFGDQAYHDYYYGVGPAFATLTRPAYTATEGYGGTRLLGTLVSRSDNSWISIFARYDRFDNAEFENSPLVNSGDGLTVGFIYTRFIFKSKTTVEKPDW